MMAMFFPDRIKRREGRACPCYLLLLHYSHTDTATRDIEAVVWGV